MPLTLADAARLSNDTLRAGVMETFVRESPVLRWMPFIEVLGNGLTYNRENAMATAAFFDVGETWTEDAPTFTQLTATLRILGGDADVDNFLARTRSNYQDLVATVIELKAKAVAHEFESTFIYGNEVVNPKQFDGLHRTIPTMQRIHVGSGATPAPLSLTRLDELIDLIRPGKPDLLIMSRRTRRLLAKFSRSASGPFMPTVDEDGQMIDRYQGLPVAVSDCVTDTETI
ncbi:MAG: phage major capsid protein, partial [Dehalococcoidia bacterium]|nr:phage major capsid protein [Dehalococcoidia bacterium]